MKVLITEDSLDSLLSIKISSDGGKTYTDYNVSSLKNNGLALDCNPNDLKVIYDTNILNYIKVLADGEKLNTGSCGGGEDKLLCYYMHVVNLDGRPIFADVIYTDKPATKISAGEIGGVEQSFYPADDGKHLFMTNVDLSGYQGSRHFVNLIYEDGSSIDLKGKFHNAPQHN